MSWVLGYVLGLVGDITISFADESQYYTVVFVAGSQYYLHRVLCGCRSRLTGKRSSPRSRWSTRRRGNAPLEAEVGAGTANHAQEARTVNDWQRLTTPSG